jgi:hypothetical protein
MGTLLSQSKSATSIALDTSEIVLLLFGILLTVGLVGEYAKSERWKRHVKTFEMLVIIGVAGELLADGGIFLFSAHLQTIADLEIAELAKKAGEANDHASQVEQENIKLRTMLAKLQRSTGPRYFSPDEQDQLVKALSRYVITNALIEVEDGNAEAGRFGEDFVSVFKRLHWNPRVWVGRNTTVGIDSATGRQTFFFPPGITIRIADPSNPPAAAPALKSALGNLDFPFTVTIRQAPDLAPGQPNLSTYLEVVLGDR